ncbi:aminopeptidase P family protein [Thalassotalea sp. M1531]|uniref:Aminopeptidase P family protein n=1 Tax=Thalassotalea algicola TaxID=2716224 RepID=A0A7Y0Q7T7_9GAMM|nr:Xaa-Pro peptidase family protein [Thalassotalea algicola]NMP31370.1 aminopeptidase P family protein [Thalassotalea algicola]
MTDDIKPITIDEYQARIKRAQVLMVEQNIDALYLNAGTNLYYFTGTRWYASERMVAAIIPQQGDLFYIAPHFEVNTLNQYMTVTGDIFSWQEHESPYQLVAQQLSQRGLITGTLAVDESTPYFIAKGIEQVCPDLTLADSKVISAGCRMQKSDTEIALLQRAKDMTLEVHKAAASILYDGISTQEVTEFIDTAHRKVGANSGSYFCIVLFGEDSSYPHGVKTPKTLDKDDVVLIDTGCQVEGYNSDITRTYVFGEPTEKQRTMWQIEKDAQLAAFNAAQIGMPCGDVDRAARDFLASKGLGPDYETPGCPHRTGHGIGLDIHEWPYLVRSDETLLARGMAFSNEPMLVIPNEFGIRLEDHFYMTDTGPKWFTEPSFAIDDPFGSEN